MRSTTALTNGSGNSISFGPALHARDTAPGPGKQARSTSTRLFEASFGFEVPAHGIHDGKIGDGRYITVTGHSGGYSNRDGWKNGGVADARKAMGIDWMTWREMAEAIPPAYSEYIAKKFLEYQA